MTLQKPFWFRRKTYGWGWYPATWQGWLILAAFLLIFLKIFIPFVSGPEPTNTGTWWYLVKIFLWAIALIGTCYLTGEKPKWQWGKPKDSNTNSDTN